MAMEQQEMPKTNTDFELGMQIVQAVKGIRFGSVEITIHDGKVVQIERKEKLRFEKRADFGKGQQITFLPYRR